MASKTAKPIHCLVLDAGPIIKNELSDSSLRAQAELLYTVPAVVAEIRDPAALVRLAILKPFVEERSPRSVSLKVISDFARRTGDLEVLSKTDLQVLALAYELECERNNGDWRLRSIPGQKRINDAPPAFLANPPNEFLAIPPSELPGAFHQSAPETRGARVTTVPQDRKQVPECLVECSLGAFKELGIPAQVFKNGDHSPDNKETVTESIDQLAMDDVAATEFEESDNEGWITPSNITKHNAKYADPGFGSQKESNSMQVATMTTDFAMQNVLLRMNLNLLSPTFQTIRQLKTWVLRCHACFAITRDMSKQFCNRCGKPTLLRTSCSTDKDGNFKVHLKKNMQWNTRGNVYSIPKPIAGSSNGKIVSGGGRGGWGQELLLVEDQKEYVRAMTTERRKKEKDLMDEDYLPNILSGERGRTGGRPKVGAGKNVNSKKRHK